ncbi:MAG TPA: SIS domain-containing protein [Actinomycetota bacterium]
MISLDDERALRAADPSGLLDMFLSLPGQIFPAFEVGAALTLDRSEPASVALCGMGGSGAAADVVATLIEAHAAVPIRTIKGHVLPAHVGKDTLVVCLSYSGGTVEAMSCYREARSRGSVVAGIASGGELAAVAGADGALVELPGDASMPRAALGSLVGGLLGVIQAAGVDRIDRDHLTSAIEELQGLAAGLGPAIPAARNEAKQIAVWLGDRVPIFWGSQGPAEVAASRWKAAFNENAKIPAFSSALPEMTHHEVVGWAEDRGSRFAAMALRHRDEHPDTARLLAAVTEVVAASGLEVRTASARGDTRLGRLLALVVLGDAASTYHALMRGIDPAPIEAIARIKERMR